MYNNSMDRIMVFISDGESEHVAQRKREEKQVL